MIPRFSSYIASHRSSLDEQRPPPPYEESGGHPSLLFADHTTTTTEVVTTTTTRTTTHLFSLPHWRKRIATLAAQKPETLLATHSMVQPRHASALVDKELPPTPIDTDNLPSTSTSQSHSLHEIDVETKRASLFPPHEPSTSSGFLSSSSTATLAQAALGIGLPHGLGCPSPTPTGSQVNTVAFTSSSTQRPTPRRIKSSSKLRALSAADGDKGDGLGIDEHRRTRGLSLNTSHLLGIGSGGDVKAKASPKEEAATPPKLLSRRTSFWIRRKATNEPSTPPKQPSPNPSLLFTPLPSMLPGSPFFPDMLTTPSPPPIPPHRPGSHSRGLSRSHSERSSSQRLFSDSSSPSLSLSPSRARKTRRPATADAPESPTSHSHITTAPVTPTTHGQEPRPTNILVSPPRRARANTNPALLNRLSLSMFSSPSLLPPSQFNSPQSTSPAVSQRTSPRPSLNKVTSIPKPQDNESPEQYVDRLRAVVSKAELAGVLAASSDDFHTRSLRAYLAQFDFKTDPLDIALRRLLMDVGLPRETQQIDRVMEAFAASYVSCHPTLFASEDHPYVIAFSLIMLHTDAFNKSNKRKMTKADYIKNTRLPGVAPEILDCFYDNIVFAPFIYVEDPVEITGSRPLSATSPVPQSTVVFGKGNRVDLYYLISNYMLDSLRVDVESILPIANPFSWECSRDKWDDEKLREAFAKQMVVPLSSESGRPSTPFFSMTLPTGAPGLVSVPEPPRPSTELWTLRATKIGQLLRKEEFLSNGKRATNRKWRPFSIVLTGSHLLFSRDATFPQAQDPASRPSTTDSRQTYPATFRSDEVVSVKDAIAVIDASYVKHPSTFRLALSGGREYLLQAHNEDEMHDWMALINYASAFKSVGVRIRPMTMSGRDVELTGMAAATSHLFDLQHANQPTPIRRWGARTSAFIDLKDGCPRESPDTSDDVKLPSKRRVTLAHDSAPMAPEVEGADQFKATFDQVKAELAAGHWSVDDLSLAVDFDTQLSSFTESGSTSSVSDSSIPSRTHVVQSKIHDLDAKVSNLQSQLDTDLRFIRNIAILTPLQRQTRDRLALAVQNVSKRIMQERLDIVRLSCHRTILARDLSAEGRDWNRTKQMALKAATERLQSQFPLPRDKTTAVLPKMNGPPHQSAAEQRPPSTASHRPESTCESFYSALDFDFLPTGDGSSSTSPVIPDLARPLMTSNSSSSNSYIDADAVGRTSADGRPARDRDDVQRHEKFYTAHEGLEEAEDWNKTRCAQRVSLVRLPSTIGMRFARDLGDSV